MLGVINVIIVVSSCLLILVVLLQNQGSGLGQAYGGSSNSYRSKRGIERSLFTVTIVLGLIFAGSLITRLLLA
ncbi:preprotein translocase subunit SecG [bacterium]|nr:preprotein translocase subunit SecG [bacterium]